ncbi:hypothetical protein K461DRAFT_312941 [Myriangium duriaei CBS 260.36]|uniref:DUF11 domain-containing protein n=1 Tax=Myriangium duriaei CBS 260.36 TaxID=1168546 RepID=A0A9P4J184_9PEZI|nr:hypothetical protein K461DRAFT_312941 [Myriangium duriaei CBS 260.36]
MRIPQVLSLSTLVAGALAQTSTTKLFLGTGLDIIASVLNTEIESITFTASVVDANKAATTYALGVSNVPFSETITSAASTFQGALSGSTAGVSASCTETCTIASNTATCSVGGTAKGATLDVVLPTGAPVAVTNVRQVVITAGLDKLNAAPTTEPGKSAASPQFGTFDSLIMVPMLAMAAGFAMIIL